MIHFQGTTQLNTLEIKKDEFRMVESKKWQLTKKILIVELLWHIFKILLPTCELIACNYMTDEKCTSVLQNTIDWLLLGDIVNASGIFCYCLYVVVKLFIYMRIYSKFEYDRHKCLLTCNLTGMLLSLPLTIVGKYFWYVDFCQYVHYRGFFYMYFFSCILPATFYIFTRADHDCFNCFNRIAP